MEYSKIKRKRKSRVIEGEPWTTGGRWRLALQLTDSAVGSLMLKGAAKLLSIISSG